MQAFDPTRAPAFRLARLGVVVDAGQRDRMPQLVRLCDRAGIDVVWLGGVSAGGAAGDAPEAAGGEEPIAQGELLRRARLGVHVPLDGDTAQALASARRLAAAIGAVDEIGFEIAGRRVEAGDLQAALDLEPSRPRLSVVVERMADVEPLLAVVDDVVLPGWAFADLETAADEVRAECAESGREPATLGVAVLVPVSVGRTEAEAIARAQMDPTFGRFGHPAETGVFGTLEECQDRVIALAHAGVTDLRCILPDTPDVHDVIAQLTAMTVGTTDVLRPGSLRSPAPPPPDGWGGRSDRPPDQRISGGSRRR